MKATELKFLGEEWATLLRLEDWDIEIEVVRAKELGGEKCLGDCDFWMPKMVAKVRVADPETVDEECLGRTDVETVLVHEILHVRFAPYSPEEGTEAHRDFEVAIHRVSEALVHLKRLATGLSEGTQGD